MISVIQMRAVPTLKDLIAANVWWVIQEMERHAKVIQWGSMFCCLENRLRRKVTEIE